MRSADTAAMTDQPETRSESSIPAIVTLLALPIALYLTYWQINAGDEFSLLPALEALLIAGVVGVVTSVLMHAWPAAKTSFADEMSRTNASPTREQRDQSPRQAR